MLEKIRGFLKSHSADALFIPHTDEFLSEHLSPDKERLRALSGFSGSSGVALVTADKAVLFTDSRYTEQARHETKFTVIDVMRESPSDWMKRNLKGAKILFPSSTTRALVAQNMRTALAKEGIVFEPIPQNPIDLFWTNRPRTKRGTSFTFPLKYAGVSSAQKVRQVAAEIRRHNWDAFLVSDPESVSWLLNKRSRDNSFLPVIFKRVLVTKDGKVIPLPSSPSLFSLPFSPSPLRQSRRSLGEGGRGEGRGGGALFRNTKYEIRDKKIALDLMTTPYDVYEYFSSRATVIPGVDIVLALRAQKNKTEIKNIRQTSLTDSAYLCEFIAWIYDNKDTADELACAEKLKQLRARNPLYLGESFEAIIGVGAHAALPHYRAGAENVPLFSAPIVLFDTGGQYLGGTTDITRTLCVGKPTSFMKKRYTQVLRGHIALAQSTLRSTASPDILDKRARQFLRADKADYGHSTGHGIGMCLSVHEGLPHISIRPAPPIKPGMVFSNEPGYYDLKNKFGIRLENMLLATEQGKNITFQNLTFIPFDPKLIDLPQLTPVDKEWLRTYHREIEARVFPLLSPKTRRALKPIVDFFAWL